MLNVLLLVVAFTEVSSESSNEARYEADRVRVRRHLSSVLDELRARPTGDDDRTPEARSIRELLLDELERYRDEGVFPRNEYVAGLSPVFIDDDGRFCAVGYLMATSGAADLAKEIARNENYSRVAEIRTEGVAEWAKWAGFTVEELALIQPTYIGQDTPCFWIPNSVCPRDVEGGRDFVCDAFGKSYRNDCIAATCLRPFANEEACYGGSGQCGCASVSTGGRSSLSGILALGALIVACRRRRRSTVLCGSRCA